MTMTKKQRLKNVANGFMAGLLMCGFRGPWRWSNLDWEHSFYRAWNEWPPQQRDSKAFPQFSISGGVGSVSQAREILWQINSRSPFQDFESQPMNTAPFGLTPEEYAEIYAEGASVEEWRDLAQAFLIEQARFE